MTHEEHEAAARTHRNKREQAAYREGLVMAWQILQVSPSVEEGARRIKRAMNG